MVKMRILSVFIALWLGGNAMAQKPVCDPYLQDAFLDKLVGKWFAAGSVHGDDVGYNFNAQWMLNHQFLEIQMTDTAGHPQYMANVSIGYNCDTKKYVAHWLDAFGASFSETLGYGTRSADTIEFLFKYPQAPLINRFIYDARKNTWSMHTVIKNDKGVWDFFGDIQLRRK